MAGGPVHMVPMPCRPEDAESHFKGLRGVSGSGPSPLPPPIGIFSLWGGTSYEGPRHAPERLGD